MRSEGSEGAAYQAAFKAYGTLVTLESNRAELLARLTSELPPGSTTSGPEPGDARFGLRADGEVGYLISAPGEVDAPCRDRELAISTVAMRIRWHVARNAHGYVFVHAGAVAHQGRALLLPGRSFAGKSTLVAALVESGATYYSDEFAVLDAAGRVHPYPHTLTIREENGAERTQPAAGLGGTVGNEPVPVGLLSITAYERGARWDPVPRSVAQGILALLDHAVPLEERPEETLETLHATLRESRVLEGARGEAEEAATALLQALA